MSTRRPAPRPWRLALIGVLLAAILAGCTDTGPAGTRATTSESTATPMGSALAAAATAAPSQSSDSLVTAVQRVAAAVKPAVVQITTEEVQANPFGQGGTAVPTGVGTGVLFDDQGHILTNNHVIAGGSRIRVSLADGRTFPGEVVGGDPQTDVAVVRVQGSSLPKAPLGDSSRLAVGEWVVAIGHALGLPGGPTVTAGVVGALNRTVQEPPSQEGAGPFLFGLIQTDASINPGNSGGPLVNLRGEVVGLNTLGGEAEGIGFAISIETARSVAEQIIQTGRAVHAYLGIRYVALTPAVAAQLGVQGTTSGALIGEVVPGSPAARAGVRPDDVITKIDGHELEGESALAQAVDAKRPGDTITLTVQRDGGTTELRATLGETPR